MHLLGDVDMVDELSGQDVGEARRCTAADQQVDSGGPGSRIELDRFSNRFDVVADVEVIDASSHTGTHDRSRGLVERSGAIDNEIGRCDKGAQLLDVEQIHRGHRDLPVALHAAKRVR